MSDTKIELKRIYPPIEEVPLQKVVIWGFVLILLVALRPFYPLFFLTFIFGFITHNAAEWLLPRMEHRMTRKRLIVYIYILFILIWVLIGFLFIPRTITQTKEFLREENVRKITMNLEKMQEKPVLRWVFEKFDFRDYVKDVQAWFKVKGIGFIKGLFSLGLQLLLAILFSFLITFDFHRLATEISKARETRLHGLYDEVAPELREFGLVMGRVFQAQAMIAVVNTVLTTIGMLVLGVPSVILLSIVVFLCSFIPVAGVFLSSAPMCLVSIAHSGVGLMLAVIAMVAIVHAIEAYFLNPRIVGAHMKMNPIIVLAILVFSEHYFGVWGLVLGVPICYYFFHYVLKEVIRKSQERHAALAEAAAPPSPA